MPADTGHGATLTLATTGSVGNIRSISSPSFSRGKVDITHLGTTNFMEYVPEDLDDPGEISAEIVFDAETPTSLPSRGTVETVTITFPIGASTNTTAATLSGTGFITEFKVPDLSTNEVQIANITIAFDGGANSGTEPTWSAET